MKQVLKSLLIWIYTWVSLAVLSIAAFVVSLFDKSGNGAHICGRLWGKGILALAGIQVELKGVRHLDLNHPQVLASNHQGAFDVFALSAYLPLQFRWVVKKELFEYPFLGMAMRKAGYISIDRENSRRALKSLKDARDRFKTGCSVVVFPEGTRSLTGQVGPFKRGSLLLATSIGIPVVPVSIKGTFSILRKGSFLIHPTQVQVVIHPPIPTSGLSPKEQKALTEEIRRIIIKDLESS